MMKKFSRFTATLLTIILILPFANIYAFNNSDYFLRQYPDPHFNLANDSARSATVEESVAILTAYSYYTKGSSNPNIVDKNGKYPSAWSSNFVQAEIEKGTLDVSLYGYQDYASVAFMAEFLSRAKGLYHWDYNNEYSFTYTSNLSVEQKMYLNVAVDHNLIPYEPNMNAMASIPRGSLNKYKIPTGEIEKNMPVDKNVKKYKKELHTYLVTDIGNGVESIKQQNKLLEKYNNDISMVTVQSAFISTHKPTDGYKYIFNKMEDSLIKELLKDTIKIGKNENIKVFLGISNYGIGGFDSSIPEKVLASSEEMDIAISEILEIVDKYDFDGINIGFEHINPKVRNEYSLFLGKLAEGLHTRNKDLMSTVGAYFKESSENASVYDYEAISAVSDYVHVILYDDFSDTAYNNRTVEPGEISNIVSIDRVLKYVTNAMPSEKILMGMASFGIDYNTTKHTAIDTTRYDLLRKATGPIEETKDAIGGKFYYSDYSGNHIVYLETDTGIRERLLRTYEYELAGASFFYLGSEHPAIMEISTELNNNWK